MRFSKLLAFLLALCLLLGMAGGCAAGTPAATPTPEVTATPTAEPTATPTAAPDTSVALTDMTGKAIGLPAPAAKIVALTASDCEILYAIGAGDTLVGRGEYCDYPEEVTALPSVQSGSDTNIEQILDLEPEVVVMSTMAQTDEQVQALESAGVAVVVSDAQDIAGVYTAIEMLGTLTGRADEAAAVVQSMKDTFTQLEGQSEDTGKTVYFEVSPLEYGLWTAGAGTFMDEIASMLGLTNAFADVAGWGQVSEEQVLARDPDYIVTITMYFGDGPTPAEEIVSRAGWGDLKAVKAGAIFNADSNEISRPGPRLADAAQALYDFIHQ